MVGIVKVITKYISYQRWLTVRAGGVFYSICVTANTYNDREMS